MDLRTDKKGNPILDQLSEEGFVDLIFRIRNITHTRTHIFFHLTASHKKETVGMDVAVVKGIRSGYTSKMTLNRKLIYRPGVWFLRSGVQSDRLVTAIAGLYRKKGPARKMVAEESFTAIALHQGPIDMEADGIKLKIFGQDDEPIDPNVYYESYFNLDLSNGIASWNEKDRDYRVPLLRAMAGTNVKKPTRKGRK